MVQVKMLWGGKVEENVHWLNAGFKGITVVSEQAVADPEFFYSINPPNPWRSSGIWIRSRLGKKIDADNSSRNAVWMQERSKGNKLSK